MGEKGKTNDIDDNDLPGLEITAGHWSMTG